MARTDVLIIGAGQAGLAMSHELGALDIDHVLLERGRVAERWRSERWDSLRLLTPNWQSRLPGYRYSGPDPDGYMTMPEVIRYLEQYASSFQAPIEEQTTVRSVTPGPAGTFRAQTNRGTWYARAVVIATGQYERPLVPSAARLTPDTLQLAPGRYRRPDDVADGGVLVVGASATGVQLADELQAAGREVTLAVGHHTRLPRTYRGRDILWWMDAMGIFNERTSSVVDVDASRKQPSLQLVGRPDHATLGLRELHARGVRLCGRLMGIAGHTVRFADDLIATTAAADLKLAALLARIDNFIQASHQGPISGAPPFEPSWPLAREVASPTEIDLRAERIRTVVWATGFRPSYPWLHVPVLTASGNLIHDGGITPMPGLVALGLTFQRRRKSAFIDGVGDDARQLARHVADSVFGHRRAFVGSPGAALEGCVGCAGQP